MNRTEALRSSEAPQWLEAMMEEENGFMRNKSWVVHDIPDGCNLMKARWVFKKKKNKEGIFWHMKMKITQSLNSTSHSFLVHEF